MLVQRKKWYQLFVDLLSRMGTGKTDGINKCLSKEWQTAEAKSEIEDGGDPEEKSTTLIV